MRGNIVLVARWEKMILFPTSLLFASTAPCRRPTRKSLKRRRTCSLVLRILPRSVASTSYSGRADAPSVRAEIAHARAVDACGGGDIEFVASIPALSGRRAEWGLQSRTESCETRGRKCIVTLRDACKPGEHGVDVQALKTALEQARSDDVLLEGLVPEEESDEPEPPAEGPGRSSCRMVPEM